MSGARHWEQDKESTLYVGNLDERCTDSLVWELMLQAGPVINVHLPKDRVTQNHQGYGFVEFGSEADADYAAKIMNQIRVWGKPIRVNKASADRRGQTGENGGVGGSAGVGAELFVGNLDSMVDEKVLYDTFSRFGPLVQAPKIARDESNLSKGYGFVSYASFEASDDAITMHGQYLMNKEVTVQYAYKKDGKGERHGDAAERALAAQAKLHGVEVTIPAMPASLIGANGLPSGPAAMQAPGNFGAPRPPQGPPGYNYGGYNAYPPQNAPPAPAPYSGGGYNAYPPAPGYPPQGFPPGNFAPTGYPPQGGMPPPARQFNQSPLQAPPAGLPARPPPSVGGYGGPPPGAPPGMGMPPGAPPGMPPGLPPAPSGFKRPNGFS